MTVTSVRSSHQTFCLSRQPPFCSGSPGDEFLLSPTSCLKFEGGTPLALAKLYDVSQRTPQGVQMAASTFALIPTAVLFAVCYRKFKSSLAEML